MNNDQQPTANSQPPTAKRQEPSANSQQPKTPRVFVSGCYDLLHSGHVEFFQQASQFGELYVGIGSDATYLEYKHRKPMFPQEERLFMVRNIKAVKEAYINEGSGVIDFLPTLDLVKPDIFVVNADGGSDTKRRLCEERGIQYIELQRTPHAGLEARSSSSLKASLSTQQEDINHKSEIINKGIPTRLDLAGTWIDQPYVSMHRPGWAITISLEPTFDVRDRCGLSTSTRNMIQKIWPMKLPKMDPEMLARLVFCFENNPERQEGHISGAQDSIGICFPGLCRHYYDNNFWPKKIENTVDEMTLRFLEEHLVMVPMEPRKPGCSVVEDKDITPTKVQALVDAADACWDAILRHDLTAFAAAYKASFEAQVAMFPGMIRPTYHVNDNDNVNENKRNTTSPLQGTPPNLGGEISQALTANSQAPNAYIAEAIAHYSAMDDVLAWKMPGAGGGGYLALVVNDAKQFIKNHAEAIELHIRRE
ncbi:MAG: adenylyltransferase/cytidyltransferase family protein [Bacteroidaceae bacterium]|nr:adenylyltransferase/cytidyltransferase family protein [Bacteroidaceae bacterium]